MNLFDDFNYVSYRPKVFVVCRWSTFTNSNVPVRVFDNLQAALAYHTDLAKKFPSFSYCTFIYE